MYLFIYIYIIYIYIYIYVCTASLPRAKPRTAYGMRAHGSASAAGSRRAIKLRVHGYTSG